MCGGAVNDEAERERTSIGWHDIKVCGFGNDAGVGSNALCQQRICAQTPVFLAAHRRQYHLTLQGDALCAQGAHRHPGSYETGLHVSRTASVDAAVFENGRESR